MTQEEKRTYLIRRLLQESADYQNIAVPEQPAAQKRLLRALMNLRPPKAIDDRLLSIQDAYLREEIAAKGITDIAALTPIRAGLYLWKGDITTLKCDGIVNAANSGLLGCFCPNHGCIDNAIHTYAGMQLRLSCAAITKGREEPVGNARITTGYNLPSRWILHTVGPTVYGELTEAHRTALARCYTSCLSLADRQGLQNLAFCCISTGEFRFPREEAAKIALETVLTYKKRSGSPMEVLFDVFQEEDYAIYRRLLS